MSRLALLVALAVAVLTSPAGAQPAPAEARGWGEIYRPDVVMDSLDWSTEAFLDRIERDLGHGG